MQTQLHIDLCQFVLIGLFEFMKKNKNEHWGQCRVISEFVYALCKLLHLKGDFRINILQFMRGSDIRKRGHAWVTRDGRDLFITPADRPESMYKIGENEKYCYWISVKQGLLQESRKKQQINKRV